MRIENAKLGMAREPLAAPFGFKGTYLTELWQTAAGFSAGMARGTGLGVQSVLWSDAEIFAVMGQEKGNALMLDMSRYALRLLEGAELTAPTDMLTWLLPRVLAYGRERSGKSDIRETFALNALVCVDNALWQLWAREQGTEDFTALIPPRYRAPLSRRQPALGCIPLVSYATSEGEILHLADEGAFLLKIKIGSDPERDGDREKMLSWDASRLSRIHELLKDRRTTHTQSGRILYYLDANGRYDSIDRLMRLIDHADKIGALERIALLEEPFPENFRSDVSSVPLRLAADESAHSDSDALRLIGQGYSAMALKPIAKTLSMSLKVLDVAAKYDIPCFCADLTVNPFLCEFNKNVAARMAPLPGLKLGVMESNGAQNYKNWDKMCTYHPLHGSSYNYLSENGIFSLEDEFYRHCGGIFRDAPAYDRLLKPI